ncbi:MAG TPA: DUF4129 domain-containing protein [Pyrinomonadaceae bacterium]|jgi:cell division protein FtsL
MPEIQTERNRFFRLLSVALVLLVPVVVRADTISAADYQHQLQNAVKALQSLQQINEADHPEYYRYQFEQTITTVTAALPEHESVQASDEACNVDNSWVQLALKDLQTSTPEERASKLSHLIERLKAIEERVGYEQRLATPAETKAHSREKLESILSRPEYATEARGQNALGRLLEDFIRWLQELLPKRMQVRRGGPGWLTTLAQALVVIVASIVIFYVLRILLRRFSSNKRRRAPKKREPRIVLGERLEPEETATDLLSEAEALARRGDIRAAIRKAYIALLVELGDRKVLTLAQHKTNRDYLNAVRNIPLLHPTMGALTDSFERHWYGFVDATENDWQSFRSRYQTALQTQI